MLPEGYVENYEKIAKDYDMIVSIETRVLSVLIDYSIQILGTAFDARILDVGCGNGWVLSRCGTIDTTGLDISYYNCRLTRKKSVINKAVQADAENIPFKNESFDLAICTDVFEHVPNATRVIQEIYRILKPGGILFFSCPFQQDLSYYDSPKYRKKYKYVHLRSVGRKLLEEVFIDWTRMAETFVTEHMQYQKSPYPIIFQVYAKRG